MKRIFVLLAALVVMSVQASCSSSEVSTTTTSDKTELTTTAAPTTAGPTTAAPTTAAPTTAAPTTAAPPPLAAMPAVVCMNLQEAQDLIQTTGVFYSKSFDATGNGRMQVVDSNWIVVSQDPAPGEPIGEGTPNLGAVKSGEPNLC